MVRSQPFTSAKIDGNCVIGDCAGISELSEEQRKVIDDLVSKWVKKPGDKLSSTNLAKHTIELTDPKSIRINPRRMSDQRLLIL